ncbi:MAG: hypothetical protein QM820_37410 [Minicystis sp.]
MSTAKKPQGLPIASNNIFTAIEHVLARMDGRLGMLVKSGAFAGAVTLAAAPTSGCAMATDENGEDLGETQDAVIGDNQTDWAQQQGQRNTYWVNHYHESWWSYNYSTCNSRFCPQYIDLFIKLAVRPAANADLNWKRVGVVYRAPGTTALTTVTGSYFSTWNNGQEEWHVKVTVPSYQNVISFNAWYQDGAGNTYYDDNNGELHVATIGPGSVAVVQMGGDPYTNVTVDATGVHGSVSARVADIDYDKSVSMVFTTDGWATSRWLEIGSGSNGWHWAEDYGTDYERWAVDLDIRGDFQQFQYAIRYRHGVVNGAYTYEFWDNNNGQNYVVNRAP